MSIVLFACWECGEDHIIDSQVKTVKHWDAKRDGYDCFKYVQYEDDPIPEDIAKSFDGFKWKCTLCGEEMEEECYTKTEYYL